MTVATAGILFSRTIRSSFASLTLLPLPIDNQQHQQQDKQEQPFLVRVDFQDNLTELRSYCRKHYKLGDHLEFHSGQWENTSDNAESSPTSWFQRPKWVVPITTTKEATEKIVVRSPQAYDMTQCQQLQNEYLYGFDKDSTAKTEKSPKTQPKKNSSTTKQDNHGTGGRPKRLLAEEVVRFFLQKIGEEKLQLTGQNIDKHTAHHEIRDFLNQGSGVLDVAGGAGHVSMALGSLGIQSTVTDCRATVGKLPQRDRKIWKRRLRKRQQGAILSGNDDFMSGFEYCQVIPFQTHRAWFGSKPKSFRHPDEDDLPIVSVHSKSDSDSEESTSSLLHTASALIALHPDEATVDTVEAAVEYRIPFLVVPCCVFARVFPDRHTSDGQPVTDYEDLLQYCREKEDSIQQATLSFEGKNIALWSTFS